MTTPVAEAWPNSAGLSRASTNEDQMPELIQPRSIRIAAKSTGTLTLSGTGTGTTGVMTLLEQVQQTDKLGRSPGGR